MQGTWVPALVWEDPTCRRATKHHSYWACTLEPANHNYWVRAPRPCAPQQATAMRSLCTATRESPRAAMKVQRRKKEREREKERKKESLVMQKGDREKNVIILKAKPWGKTNIFHHSKKERWEAIRWAELMVVIGTKAGSNIIVMPVEWGQRMKRHFIWAQSHCIGENTASKQTTR